MTNTFKNMLSTVFVLLALLLSPTAAKVHAQTVSPTKYDYTAIAKQITENSNTKLEQAEAIYRWLCSNIAYDTEHKIHTADECWERRRGVCQAYCELFYRLAEPLSIKCTIIPGVTKNSKGSISEDGHAWLLVEVEDGGILTDPTWGAGGVKDGVFIASDNDMSWFRVDPYWMIFTHHPDDSTNQFIDTPITREVFANLPYIKPTLGDYGWEAKGFYTKHLQGEFTSLPHILSAHAADLSIKDIPLQAELTPGQHYTFKIAKHTDSIMALVHDGEFVYDNAWLFEDSCYTISYMPTSAGPLSIVVACGDGNYSTAIEYQVTAPTTQAMEQIRQDNPYRLPEVKTLANLYPERMEALGISGERILHEARENGLKAIFMQHKDTTSELAEIDVPLSQYLTIGKSYRFAIRPTNNTAWAVFNEGVLYNNWTIDEATGWRTIEVCPTKTGRLTISMGIPPEMKKYRAMLIYTVLE